MKRGRIGTSMVHSHTRATHRTARTAKIRTMVDWLFDCPSCGATCGTDTYNEDYRCIISKRGKKLVQCGRCKRWAIADESGAIYTLDLTD